MPNILALDIGGANIKVANGLGYARSWPFALWKSPEQLADKLGECLAAAPQADEIVVTMTGELCDCFETKRAGVRSIVEAAITASRLVPSPVKFYQTTGELVLADEACETYLLTAASNWHALATFAAKFCEDRPGILIDIGSTTTDIIPIEQGQEVARGRTDPERLGKGELAYQGVERTPVCAIVSHLRWREASYSVANELFATTGDAYLLLSELPEDPANTSTADGKPFTRSAAHTRLARMICADRDSVTADEALSFAAQIRDSQLKILEHGLLKVIDSLPGMPETVVLSGQGAFLAYQAVDRLRISGKIVSLNERLGPEVSRCGCAHALAFLAPEQLPVPLPGTPGRG